MAPTKEQVASSVLHVGFVLDRSGSMGHIWPFAVTGLNDYVQQLQQDEEAETTFLTLGVFDDVFELPLEHCPVSEVPAYAGHEFAPRGMTALYDAVAKMVHYLDGKAGEDKVLIVVLTDGFENASKEQTRSTLAALVSRFEEKGSWTFVYLGANDLNVKETAMAMGIPAGNAASYSSSASGYIVASGGLANLTQTRKTSTRSASPTAFADAGVREDLRDEADSGIPEPDVDPFANFKKSSLSEE